MDLGFSGEGYSAMSPESMEVLQEGISLVLSQWSALQMAVRHEWGGCDSGRKCDELAATLLSCFCQSKAPVSIEDLENVLDENLLLSFNTEIVDGSVEEIAEQLLLMHEDCLCGNYHMIQKLRRSVPAEKLRLFQCQCKAVKISHLRKIIRCCDWIYLKVNPDIPPHSGSPE